MVTTQCLDFYAGDVASSCGQVKSVADKDPFTVVELDIWGCEKLLQGPTSGEPAASSERLRVDALSGLEICEVDVADCGISVPGKHAVDGLGKLGTTGLVDATRVDPNVGVASLSSLLAAGHDFPCACLGTSLECVATIANVFEEKLVFLPRVGEDGIFRSRFADEAFKLQCGRIEKSHGLALGMKSQWIRQLSGKE